MSEHADSADSLFARGPWKPFEPKSQPSPWFEMGMFRIGGLTIEFAVTASESDIRWSPVEPPAPEGGASPADLQ
jgi:hypothetical protein